MFFFLNFEQNQLGISKIRSQGQFILRLQFVKQTHPFITNIVNEPLKD